MLRIDGTKLHAVRTAAGVSTEDLAKIAGLSRRRMQQLESDGGRLNRNIGIAVARYLEVKTRDICKEDGEEAPP